MSSVLKLRRDAVGSCSLNDLLLPCIAASKHATMQNLVRPLHSRTDIRIADACKNAMDLVTTRCNDNYLGRSHRFAQP